MSDLVEFKRLQNELEMEDQTLHLRHTFILYFLKGKNASEVHKNGLNFTVTIPQINVSVIPGLRNHAGSLMLKILLGQDSSPRLMTTKLRQ